MSESGSYPCIELILTIGTWDLDAFATLDTGFDGGLLIPIGVGREFRVEVAAIGSRFLLGREVLDRMGVCFEFRKEVTLRFRD